MLAQGANPAETFSDDDCLSSCFLPGPTTPQPGSVLILAYVVPRDAPTIVDAPTIICNGVSLMDFAFLHVGWQVLFAPGPAARWHGFFLLGFTEACVGTPVPGPTEIWRDILLLSRTGPWRGNLLLSPNKDWHGVLLPSLTKTSRQSFPERS